MKHIQSTVYFLLSHYYLNNFSLTLFLIYLEQFSCIQLVLEAEQQLIIAVGSY